MKGFIEKLWLESRKLHSKLALQRIQQNIRTRQDDNGEKLFQTNEYPTLSQVKSRPRKLEKKYGVTSKNELIAELIKMNTE